jgi:hypothetical protein
MTVSYYTWNFLTTDPATGTLPNHGPFVPQPLIGGSDQRKIQFERGIKFANVPGSQAKFIVHGGARVYHVNSVMTVLAGPPVIHAGDNDSGNGGGHSTDSDRGGHGNGYSGAIKFRFRDYRKAPIPNSINVKENRGTDSFGNTIFEGTGQINLPTLGHILNIDALALWRFDEPLSSSNALDQSNGNTLFQFGKPPSVAGQVGGARQVNSSRYFQGLGNSNFGFSFQNQYSIESWVNPSPGNVNSGTLFVYAGRNYQTDLNHLSLADVFYSSGSNIGIHHWRSTASYSTLISSGALIPNTWSHVAVVKSLSSSSVSYKVYINGALDTDFGLIPAGLSGGLPFISGSGHLIGVGNYVTSAGLGLGSESSFSGSIDDTRISDLALSSNKILESYNRGIGRY